MRYINEKKYQRINIETGQVIDELTISGEMSCNPQNLSVCDLKKCLGTAMVTPTGKKYCTHPTGVMFKEVL